MEQKRQLETILEDSLSEPENLTGPVLQSKFSISLEDLRNEKFPVMFAGRFSTGKSTLLNRLFLGRDLLPTAVTPTTARNVIIRYGTEGKFYLSRRKPGAEEWESHSVAADMETIRRYCTHQGDRKDEYENFHLELPLEELRDGVVFVDTVGTDEIDDEYVSRTINSIGEAAALVYLTSALQPLAQSELDFLRSQLGETPKRLFLVVNKIDTRPEWSARMSLAEDVAGRFRRFYLKEDVRAEDKLFLISAKTGEGLEELRRALLDFVVTERVNELVFQTADQCARAVEEESQKVERSREQLQLRLDGDLQRLGEQREELGRLRGFLQERESDTLAVKERLLQDAREQVTEALHAAEDRVLIKLSRRVIEPEELQKLIAREIRLALEPVERRLAQSTLEYFQERLGALGLMAKADSRGIQAHLDPAQMGELRKNLPALLKWSGIGFSSMGAVATAEAILAGSGGTAALPWLSSLAAGTSYSAVLLMSSALPALAVGGLALYGGKVAAKRLHWYRVSKNRQAVISLFREIPEELLGDLQERVETRIAALHEQLVQEVGSQIEELETLMEESSPEVLQAGIADADRRLSFLDSLRGRLGVFL
jgi:GTPase Era involved in 16S rRNA processing